MKSAMMQLDKSKWKLQHHQQTSKWEKKRKQIVLYFKTLFDFGLLGSVFAFLTSRKPQCLGMHLWTVRRVRNAGGQYLAFEKLPKRSTLCFALLPQKLSNILEERWSFLILSEQSYCVTWQLFLSSLSSHILWNGEGKRRRQKSQKKNINLDSSSRKRAHVDKMSLGNERSL